MKTLNTFAATKSVRVVNINYRHCGYGRKQVGFDLVDSDNNIHVSIEPCNYTNYKWMVSAKNIGCFHLKNMAAVIKYLSTANITFKGTTGFKLSA